MDAHKTTGGNPVDLPDLNVEFFPGRNKQGEKTGQIYWTYTEWNKEYKGGRKRTSPTKHLGKTPGITRIENCPHESRVAEYLGRNA